MFRMILADWRRLLLVQGLGMLFWPFLTYLILRELMFTRCCGGPFPESDQIRHQLISLAWGQAPLIFWIQADGAGFFHRQRLTDVLPLSVHKLNLSRLVTASMFFVLGLAPWIYTWIIWLWFGYSVYIWLPIFVSLALAGLFFFSMRNRVPRIFLVMLFPVILIPGSHEWFRQPLQWITTPWASAALAALVVPFGRRVMRQAPPRWTR